jgi:phage-related protein
MAILYTSPAPFDESSRISHTARSIKSSFGDGYQEVTPDGINNIVRTGTIVHRFVPQSTNTRSVGAGVLRTFLRQNCGTNTVVQIPNWFEDPTGSTTLNVYLESWSESYTGNTFTFTIKFRESFNV